MKYCIHVLLVNHSGRTKTVIANPIVKQPIKKSLLSLFLGLFVLSKDIEVLSHCLKGFMLSKAFFMHCCRKLTWVHVCFSQTLGKLLKADICFGNIAVS